MRNRKIVSWLAAALLSVFCLPSIADDSMGKLNWSGFASTAASFTDTNETYIEYVNKDASFLDTRLGLNLSLQFSAQWSLGGQILAAGREGGFDAHADWVFSRYRFSDNTSLLFGKMKYPNLLFSEYYDAGSIYPWARIPQELYNLAPGGSRAGFEAMSGVSVLLSRYPNEIEYILQPYYGEASSEAGTVKGFLGLVFSMIADEYTVKFGYNMGEFNPGGGHSGEEEEEEEEEIGIHDRTTVNLGVNANVGPMVLIAEIASSTMDGYESLDSNSGYASFGYPFESKSMTPFLIVGRMIKGSGLAQTSVGIGLTYASTAAVSVKVQLTSIDVEAAHEEEEEEEEEGHDEVPGGLFFEGAPEDGRANMLTISVDFAF